MIENLEDFLSINSKGMKRSAIRELLKLTQQPDVISFAGGLPSPESFPVAHLKEVINEVMETQASMVLQYGTTEGDTLLKEMLIEHYRQYNVNAQPHNLLITTASQQGLDLVAKIFLNRGDKVIAELPSYLGGLSAFFSYGAEVIGIPMDDDGMRMDLLEETLENLKSRGEKAKFIYTVPDFQNPAGVTMSDERRIRLVELAKKYDIFIVEDSPYKELRFDGQHQKTIYSLDDSGSVLLLGTFSKIFVPGFRLGWVFAHEKIIDRLVVAKQATDLCTPAFNQRVAGRFMEKGYLKESIARIVGLYKEKRDIMLSAMTEYMPPGVTWTKPRGGLFLFLKLPQYMDAEQLLYKAIEKKVAYVAGVNFFCDGTGKNTARINFSFASKERNVEGVQRLARLIKQNMA